LVKNSVTYFMDGPILEFVEIAEMEGRLRRKKVKQLVPTKRDVYRERQTERE